jgi:hypothetical protein
MKTILLAISTVVILGAQQPVLDCAVLNSQAGQITAYFGYTGASPGSTVPLGGNNFIDAGGIVYGSVPQSFPQAAQHIVFSVKFNSALTVGWHVNGQSAVANAGSVAATPCQAALGSTLPVNAQLRCWDKNGNRQCDPGEDVDGDGYCTILDCAGPQGSTGLQGNPGPTGPAGPAGPAGTPPPLETVTSTPAAANATATCASTRFLVTGGGTCTVPNLPNSGRLAVSAPTSSGDGWTISCNAGQAAVAAVCGLKQ